jgi:hypothetical protein
MREGNHGMVWPENIDSWISNSQLGASSGRRDRFVSHLFLSHRRIRCLNQRLPDRRRAIAREDDHEPERCNCYRPQLSGCVSSARRLRGADFEGEKPADLQVVQLSKFELVINLKTAKALG